jgi:hypothetical protein
MRPGIGLDSNAAEPLRPRKPSNADASSLTGDRDRCNNNSATTFFLSRDPDGAAGPQQAERASATMSYNSPLSSLQDTMHEADRAAKHTTPRSARSGSRRRSTIKPGTAERFIRRGSSDASANAEACITQPPQSTLSDKERARAITPSPLPSRDASLPSSPKSLASRQSLSKSSSASDNELLTSADETDSQAILSSGEEDEDEGGPERSPASQRLRPPLGEGVQDSHPELIMPSIKMPSRRPFTQRGKRLGRFKIMVAGRKGAYVSTSDPCGVLTGFINQASARHALSNPSSNSAKTLSTSIPLSPQQPRLTRLPKAGTPSMKSMHRQNPTQSGGLPWKNLAFFASGSPWEIPYWNGISVSLTLLTRLD